MSFLLFMDESGHDHRHCPYEVRGGVTLHVRRLWPFIQALKNLEEISYGTLLHRYGREIKGHKLLDKDRFRWARQIDILDDEARRKHCIAFLNKTARQEKVNRIEFSAYGQASLKMAREIFSLLNDHEIVIFASVIPKNVRKPDSYRSTDYLRKDQVFMFERFFNFLEKENEQGILVLDETETRLDRKFVEQMERYFTKTYTGRYRSSRVVPSPFFVSSDMTYPIQVADLCIYCINWGFRIPYGMDGETRVDIEDEFQPWLNTLQYRGESRGRDGEMHHLFGIVFVPDPYENR